MAGQKTNKGRKIGRNKAWCERYRAAGKREISKARRLLKHLKRYPADGVATASLATIETRHVKTAQKSLPDSLDKAA